MKKEKYRINIFLQISEFYKIVFNGKFNLNEKHISVYFFLINQDNRCNWSEWINISIDIMMIGTKINRIQTLYQIIQDLHNYKLIEWQKGINKFQAAKYKIIKLNKTETLNVPQAERVNATLSANLYTLLTETLPANVPQIIYRQFNEKLYKAINDNLETIKANAYLIQIKKK
jgi:hypothetical protein